MKKRIFASLILILSPFFLPVELCAVFFVLAVSFFGSRYEAILAGFFADAVFIQPGIFSKARFGFFTIAFAAAFFGMVLVEKAVISRGVFSKISSAISGFFVIAAFFLILGI